MKNICLMLILFCSLLINGQTRLGASLGVGISDRYNDNNRTNHQTIGEQNAQIGTLFSLNSETSFNDNWFLAGGLNYTNLSFSENINMTLIDPSSEALLELCGIDDLPKEGIASIKHNFSFIQIPIVINYVFVNCKDCGWKWNVGLGPSFDISLNHKIKTPLIDENQYRNVNCLIMQSVVLGIQAEIGTTYEFAQNANQLRFSLFYNSQFQPLYEHPLNYSLVWGGVRVSYLFTIGANNHF